MPFNLVQTEAFRRCNLGLFGSVVQHLKSYLSLLTASLSFCSLLASFSPVSGEDNGVAKMGSDHSVIHCGCYPGAEGTDRIDEEAATSAPQRIKRSYTGSCKRVCEGHCEEASCRSSLSNRKWKSSTSLRCRSLFPGSSAIRAFLLRLFDGRMIQLALTFSCLRLGKEQRSIQNQYLNSVRILVSLLFLSLHRIQNVIYRRPGYGCCGIHYAQRYVQTFPCGMGRGSTLMNTSACSPFISSFLFSFSFFDESQKHSITDRIAALAALVWPYWH